MIERVRRWVESKQCLAAGFLWGFAEGTLFFLIPDIIITFVALFSIKASLKQMLSVLAGALLAGLLMYSLAVYDYELMYTVVNGVPYVFDSMFVTAASDLKTSGAMAMYRGPMSGIPYKVYAIQAPQFVSLLSFLLWSIPARMSRFVITWSVFAVVGYLLRKRIGRVFKPVVTLFTLYWVVVYAIFWSWVQG